MKSDYTVSNVLSASWRAFSSQVWILVGLLIGYTILSFTLSAVLQPVFSTSVAGGLFVNLLSLAVSLIFTLGYLKNIFQTLDGDEPRFSAYGQQAHKALRLFVAVIIYSFTVSIAACVTIIPYIYLLYQSVFAHVDLMRQSMPDIGWLPLFLTALGGLCLLLPAIYLGIRFMFCQAFIVDDNTGAIESLKKSWAITKGNMTFLVLLELVSFVIMIAGLMVFVIGIFVAVPLVYSMHCYTFRKLNRYRDDIAL
ncbi:MAG: glycerophosphoryl diester phosphodiesterase membrane domain-containing protein [Tannerellaceae bacterium]|jgi:hypothetical protein|nr:glycerophosphoryl diester phosphodiesterase membrane domain-containing protein [Tannerellaceae bacterium]